MQQGFVRLRCCSTCHASYRADFARCPVDGGLIGAVDADPLIGVTVGHYTIDRLLGEGGMGRVYAAHHTLLAHRRVALKVLLGDLAATMSTRMRFSKEAEAASQLDHPNVVSVTDFGRTDAGLLYLAMELVPGRPLSSLIAEGPMAPRRVIALVRQLTAGLGHAHERGFVHRDFKPDNVLVVDGEHGEVARIVDFGLAISADPTNESPRFTTVGIVVGTPIYAAPEQTHGRPIDHRADLFALGVTMFEMLAGTVPYDGTLGDIVLRNASGDIPSIRSRAPGVDVPPELEALVRRLMAPVESDRPQSTREVLDALDALDRPAVTGETSPVASPTTTPDADSPIRRPSRARWTVAAALVLAGGVVATLLPGRDLEPAPPPDSTGVLATTVPPASASAPTSVPPLARAASTVVAASQTVAAPRVAPVPDAAPAERPGQLRAPRPRRVSPVPPGSRAGAAEPAPDESAITTTSSAVAEDEPPPVVATAPVTPVVEGHAVGPASHTATEPTVVTSAPAPARPPSVRPSAVGAAFESIQVRGSLPTATVRRALDRVLPAARACHGTARGAPTSSPLVLGIQLVIDEHQRATSVRVAGTTHPGLSACVTAALEGLRSDVAPDVGTVTVRAALRFSPEGA